MGRNNMKKIFSLSTVACAISTILSVQAAEIEVINVTATKRVENMQQVPVSVSAISADALKSLKIRDTTEIAAQVPNMQISTPAGDSYPIISIRGISMDDFSLNQSASVAIYVDEVYKGNPALQSVQLFDMERIEVLRGPQGTLFGKNTTGGLVNFITKRPSFDTGGYATVGFGNNNRKEFKGAFETELNDKLAVRFAGTFTEMDGWKKNILPGGEDANGIEEWGARASFAYMPNDDVDVLLKISTSKAQPNNYAYTAIPASAAGQGLGAYEAFNGLGPDSFPTALGVTPPAGAPQTSYTPAAVKYDETSEDTLKKRTIENTAVSLNINWDVSEEYSITSITSYDEGDITIPEGDGTPNKIHSVTVIGDVEQFTQDFRVTSNFDGDFNFIAGAFISQEEIQAPSSLVLYQDLDLNVDGALDWKDCYDPLAVAFGLPTEGVNTGLVEGGLNGVGDSLANYAGLGCQLKNDYTQEKDSLGFYFDASYALNDTTTVRFGARSTTDTIKLKNFQANYFGSDDVLVLQTITQNTGDPATDIITDEIDETEWSGKVSVDHILSSGDMVYVSYNRGYRSGAFNGQAFNDPSEVAPVDPEIIDAFEAGFKAEFFSRQLRLNGAAFYYDYSDQQFLSIDPATAAQTLHNISSSEIKGLEFDLTAAITDDLTLRAGFGYLDAKAKEGTVSGVDISGNTLSQSPEFNANISLDYFTSLNGSGSIQWHVDSSWVDKQYFDIGNTEATSQDSYALVNARVTWSSPDEMYQVAIWGKNLTDEEYITKAFDVTGLAGGIIAHTGQPSSFGAEVTVNF